MREHDDQANPDGGGAQLSGCCCLPLGICLSLASATGEGPPTVAALPRAEVPLELSAPVAR